MIHRSFRAGMARPLDFALVLAGVTVCLTSLSDSPRAQIELDLESRAQDITRNLEIIRELEPEPEAEPESEQDTRTGREVMGLSAGEEARKPKPKPIATLSLLGSLSYSYTTNAFQSNANRSDDHYVVPSAALVYKRRLWENGTIHLGPSFAYARYADNEDLGFGQAGGEIGLSQKVGRWLFQAIYKPEVLFSDDLDDHLLTVHRLQGVVSFDNIALRKCRNRAGETVTCMHVVPKLTLQRSFADPDDSSNTLGQLAFGIVSTVPDDNIEVNVTPRIRGVLYDDFPGEQRRDLVVGVSGGLSWVPANGISVSATVAYAKRFSTRNANDYDGFEITPGVGVRIEFPVE